MNVLSTFAVWLVLCFITFIIITNSSCHDAYSCASSTIYINESSATIECFGYKSCANSIMGGSGTFITAACNGNSACVNASTSTKLRSMNCVGMASCTSMNSETSSRSSCSGQYSCINANIVGLVSCDAEMSCAFTNIYLVDYSSSLGEVSATSALSMYGSHIYTQQGNLTSDHVVSLSFTGYYSGYNATLHCMHPDDVCTVTCLGNGCYNLNIDCHENATCNVNCDDQGIGGFIDVCPNGYGTNNSSIYNNTYLMHDIFLNLDTLYGYLLSSIVKDSLSNSNYGTNWINERVLSSIDICHGSNNTMNNSNIIGLDYRQYYEGYNNNSASGNTPLTNKSICCLAEESCYDNSLSTIGNGNANLNGGNYGLTRGDIFCDGLSSCEYSDITINVMNATIHASGQYGIISSNIRMGDSNVLACGADEACEACNITGGRAVIATAGSYVAAYSQFENVTNIYAFGQRSIEYPEPEPIKNKFNYDLNVYCMGYYACEGVNVECRGNDPNTTCTIYCYYRGCRNDYALPNCSVATGNEAKCAIKYQEGLTESDPRSSTDFSETTTTTTTPTTTASTSMGQMSSTSLASTSTTTVTTNTTRMSTTGIDTTGAIRSTGTLNATAMTSSAKITTRSRLTTADTTANEATDDEDGSETDLDPASFIEDNLVIVVVVGATVLLFVCFMLYLCISMSRNKKKHKQSNLDNIANEITTNDNTTVKASSTKLTTVSSHSEVDTIDVNATWSLKNTDENVDAKAGDDKDKNKIEAPSQQLMLNKENNGEKTLSRIESGMLQIEGDDRNITEIAGGINTNQTTRGDDNDDDYDHDRIRGMSDEEKREMYGSYNSDDDDEKMMTNEVKFNDEDIFDAKEYQKRHDTAGGDTRKPPQKMSVHDQDVMAMEDVVMDDIINHMETKK